MWNKWQQEQKIFFEDDDKKAGAAAAAKDVRKEKDTIVLRSDTKR